MPVGLCLLAACVATDRSPGISRLPEAPEWLDQVSLDTLAHGEANVDLGDKDSARNLSLTVERRDRLSGRHYDGRPNERWRNTVTADVAGQVGEAVRLGLSANLAESLRTTESGTRALLVGSPLDWRQNAAANLELSLGLADDRLKFTASQALSDYVTSDPRDGPARGFSLAQRLDANLIRSDALRLSAFASHSVVDDEFVSMGLSTRRRAFERRGYRTYGVGGTIGSGSVDLTLSRTARTKVNDRGDGYEEEGYEALVSVALDGLWSRMGDAIGGGFWTLAPGSVWLKWAPASIDPGERGTGRRDNVQEYGFGSSWSWGGGYADLGFWRYVYDSRQIGAEDADWLGHGIHGNVGFYGEAWSVDAGLAFSRGRNEELFSRSQDTSHDGYLSFSYRPTGFPDMTLGLSVGRYGIDYIAYDAASLTDYWELSAELDFSKFLMDKLEHDGPNLRAVYGLRAVETDDDFSGNIGEAEHVLGILYKRQF